MKRTILSLTTAIALAMPAASYADVDDTVMGVLESNGYEAAAIEMLTEGQIAEIYLAATSEDQSNVRNILDGIEFGSDSMPMNLPMSDAEAAVADALEINGYSADMVNSLSSGDIAAIYTAYTSDDQAATRDAITSAIETNSAMVSEDPSDAEVRAQSYLARTGYSAEQIDSVEQGELVEIYLALTSGDQNAIDTAVTSAIDS